MDSIAYMEEQSTQARRVIVHPQPPRNLQAPVARGIIAAATGVQPNAAPPTGTQNPLPNMVNPNLQQAAASSVQASMNSNAQMHPTAEQSTQEREVITHPQPHQDPLNAQHAILRHWVAIAQLSGVRALGAQNALRNMVNPNPQQPGAVQLNGVRAPQPNMINPNPQQPGPAASSVQGQANVITDWREKIYVKIKATKDIYLPQLQQIRQKIVNGLQQHDANPRQENVQHMQRLRLVRASLDQIIQFLHVQKANVTLNHSAFLARYQKEIQRLLDFYNPERPIPYVPYAGFCSKYRSTVLRG